MLNEEESRKFDFINEQIRKKPFYKKKWFLQGLAGIGLAIVFGSMAGISFSIVKPWAEKQFGQPDEPPQIVTILEETETQTQTQEETEMQSETQTEPQTEPQTEEETEKEFGISDYMNLYGEMYEVASEAMDSIVTVTGISSETDLFNKVIENNVQVSGLIIANNQSYLYILTENRAFEETQKIVVTFMDGSIADATLQKTDRITKLAVIKVPIGAIEENTLESIEVARLGSSKTLRQGIPVISVGSPLGYSNSVAFGMVTSITAKSVTDSEYQVISTDMIGNSQSSGILIDLNGKIVGIVARDFRDNEQTTICALAISDLKYLIEMLSNGNAFTYMGITGVEITEAIAGGSDIDMPRGIYVREVEMDSPAMDGNIMVGDILVAVDGQEILTMEDYIKMLRSHEAEDVISVKLKRIQMEEYTDVPISMTLGKY